MADLASTYRGRFAPSPTGPLHRGSLVAALASFLDARHHRGLWLVRIDDIDPPRETPGAAQHILNSLQQHGLYWDEPVLWQSSRKTAYQQALAELASTGLLFHCDCTRSVLGPNGSCDGRCSPRQAAVTAPWSLRIAVLPDTQIEFLDGVYGSCRYALGNTIADFVVQRKDSLFAYQLAAAVDDTYQGITHVVRGADLLDSTPRQLFLIDKLGRQRPRYTHVPVLLGSDGQKLSKQNHAPALVDGEASGNLRDALAFLNQPCPPATTQTPSGILEFAIQHWSIDRIVAHAEEQAK